VSSQSSVSIARSLMDAMKRGDVGRVRELAHADYEFHTTSALPGAGVHRGLESVMEFNRQFNDTWETFSIEEDRVLRSADTVVILGRSKATGKASGVTVETSIGYVHDLRAGKHARTRGFFDHDAALRAAELASAEIHPPSDAQSAHQSR
jgi:ketosteroid isomerase-like protein